MKLRMKSTTQHDTDTIAECMCDVQQPLQLHPLAYANEALALRLEKKANHNHATTYQKLQVHIRPFCSHENGHLFHQARG